MSSTSEERARQAGICRLVALEQHRDERGVLSVVEPEQELGFAVRRVYYLHGLEAGTSRGGHAHRFLEQLVIAVHGSFRITVDDGARVVDHRLDRPGVGMYVGPMVWRELSDFSTGAVCLVLASDLYDEADYCRDYAEFRRIARRRP